MSDNFIPLNQSTPVQQRRHDRNRQTGHQNNWHQRYQQRRSQNYNRWGNNSQRNGSFGNDNSPGGGSNNIDAYLHPSMLQDPWAHLTQHKK